MELESLTIAQLRTLRADIDAILTPRVAPPVQEDIPAHAMKADRWQHTYETASALPHIFGEHIDPDDGHAFIGPWEPVGCAVDPGWQIRGEIVPTLVTLWRRPLRKVTT